MDGSSSPRRMMAAAANMARDSVVTSGSAATQKAVLASVLSCSRSPDDEL
jgi:hypothetical protein